MPLLTGRFAVLMGLACLVLPLAPGGSAWLWWLGLNMVLLAMAGLDWALSVRASYLAVQVDLKGHWVRGEVQTVRLNLENRAGLPVGVTLRQDLPASLGGPAPVTSVACPVGASAIVSYPVTPRERGDHAVGDVHGRWPSRLGLLVMRGLWPQSVPVRVYAPLYMDRGPGLPSHNVQLQEKGVALRKAGGVQTEFESLREYREGDDFRAVNWRASARRDRLVVNEYQAERTQQVMLVLDAGRLMVPEYNGVPRFEYALSAALQLGRLAAEREDRVGMMLFGGDREAMLLPARGQAQVARLAEAAYRVQPQMLEPDYAGAVARLSGSLKRRSLILFFTDFLSPEASRLLCTELQRLVPRHLVVVMAISDPAMTGLARRAPESVADAYKQAAADWVLEERAGARKAIARGGISVLDVPPHGLSSAALAKYVEVKRRGLL